MAEFHMTMDIRLPDDIAGTVYRALKPETLSLSRGRTRLSLEMGQQGLKLTMAASDLVAARALANSFIRLLDISIGVCRVAGYG